MRKSILLSVLFLFAFWSDGVSQEIEKLFDSEVPISMKMNFSIKEIKSKTNDSTYMDSEISVQTSSGSWETFPFEIRTRGNFRLANCYYPPMRIKLKKDEAKGTIFQGNRSLKLVLPCSKTKFADSFLGKEYLAYQLFEQVTPYTFDTRLVRVEFTNLDDKKAEPVVLLGILIEDDDEVAKRFDGEILSKKIPPNIMEDSATVRHDLFQMMIGNTDWSGLYQHNQKVMLVGEKTIIPLAYDFDMTGLVNPPYGQVNSAVGIEKITDRMFRGFCRDPALVQTIRKEFLAKESKIFQTIELNKQYFSEADAKWVNNFIKEFYDILKNDKLFQQKVLESCRKADGTYSF
ncbi:MAG: hypothetical protein KGZ90_13195 [Algoriphagus sp.]|nr:hypothetical protein [Algoriphagus sp.]